MRLGSRTPDTRFACPQSLARRVHIPYCRLFAIKECVMLLSSPYTQGLLGCLLWFLATRLDSLTGQLQIPLCPRVSQGNENFISPRKKKYKIIEAADGLRPEIKANTEEHSWSVLLSVWCKTIGYFFNRRMKHVFSLLKKLRCCVDEVLERKISF